jgi:mono/diheme cytochrome c family protein
MSNDLPCPPLRRRAALAGLAVALLIPQMAEVAVAADAGRGRLLARSRCAACHVVAPNRQRVVAQAPPFETIARKFGYDATTLTFDILAPHPRMNVSPSRRDAADIAAYMASLAR